MAVTDFFAGKRLVLKSFEPHEGNDGINESQMTITGRQGGIIGWLLNMLDIDSKATIDIFADRVEFTYGSLKGRMSNIIPLTSVSMVTTGFSKPLGMVFFAVFMLFTGLIGYANRCPGYFWFTVFVAGFCGMVYFLKQCLAFIVTTHGGHGANFSFANGIAEDIKVTNDQAEKIMVLMKANMRKMLEKKHEQPTDVQTKQDLN